VLANPIIRLFTTEPYYSAWPVIPFVAFGSFLYGLSLISAVGLHTSKKTHIIARNWLIAATLNIVLNIIFIPVFGYIAAAVTTLVSYSVLFVINIMSSKKYLRWSVLPRSVGNSIIASVLMGGAVFLIIQISSSVVVNIISSVVIGIVIYTGGLFLLKEISKEEIKQIKALLKFKYPWSRRS
jgi:O-antigen/teichoic acid export membrane protein